MLHKATLVSTLRLATVVWGTTWATASCSKADETAFECKQAYGARCGQACSDVETCDPGLHCGGGVCQAECGPAGGCGEGHVCSTSGACVVGGPGDGAPMMDCSSGQCRPANLFGEGGLQSGGGGGFFEGDACVNLNVGFESKTPTVMLLVDQSGSMFDVKYPEGAQTTRWSVLRDALMDTTLGAVTQLEASVRMGLMLYTNLAATLPAGACPQITKVPIALNNYAAINAVYQAAPRGEETPTGASILAATQALANEPDPKYILLVTDGEPDTCDDPNPSTPAAQDVARGVSVSAAQAAYAQRIGLIIMGVSNQIAPAHLQAMANAGVGKDPALTGKDAAPYFVAANNQTALASQLSGILGSVRNCRFQLAGKVATGRAPDGIVSLDEVLLKLDDPNGFRLNSPSELEILGTACEKIKTDGKTLSVSFPCDAVEIAK